MACTGLGRGGDSFQVVPAITSGKGDITSIGLEARLLDAAGGS